MTDRRAYVLGDLDLIRPLAMAGVRCVPVTASGAPARWSKATDKGIDLVEVWHEPARMVDRLLDAAADDEHRPVLFYQRDEDELMISRFRDQLRERFDFVIGAPDLVEACADKERFADFASRAGLRTPVTAVFDTASEPPPPADAFPYPIIVKPALRDFARWRPVAGVAKAMRFDNPNDAALAWESFGELGARLIVQELVEGDETRVESYHLYATDAGQMRAEFTSRKIRCRPKSFGNSTALTLSDEADVFDLGRKICDRLGLTGVAKLDFKRTVDNRLVLLEINPRFTLWAHPAAVAGVNIPEMVMHDLTHGPPPPGTRVATPERLTTWCKPWEDVFAARDHGIGIGEWIRWAWKCDSKRALSIHDPGAVVGVGAFMALQAMAPLRSRLGD
ncbi:MAG: ATP-grasp domain-containing protein [Acidimicrobiia bacterium]